MRSWRRPSLSTGILLALGLGVASGIFFGERVAFLKPLADAFIRLLQMAVLPYIMVSLVAGLGRLTRREAAFLARQGGQLLLLLWGIALVLVVAFPIAFPVWETASFFSTTLVEPPTQFDFVELFIPANPFRSAADNVVPAVVLFSIAVGVALMTVPRRQLLIETLEVFGEALTRITHFAVSLTPIGVFAIAASTAGTITVEEFGRLQVYLLTYVAFALLATFWVLPGLVAALTPLSWRDVMRASREALLTAFSTGSLLVVLPLLAERSKELLAKLEVEGREAEGAVDVLVPVSFNFPNVGKLLTLAFVLFAGWFAGAQPSPGQYPSFLVSGLLTFFGSVNVAIPFLLDLLRIPADMFQLFVAVGFLNFRFSTLVSTMHTLVLSVLAAYAVARGIGLRWPPLARYLAVTGASLALVLGGMRLFFEIAIGGSYQGYELLTERRLSRPFPPPVVHQSRPEATPALPEGGSRLDVIRERGALRAGYHPQNLPMTYFNAADDLVGFDVEMAHLLARDLGVQLEMVPIDFARLPEQLATGEIDLVMAGIVVTPDRARQFAYSTPYLEPTLAFVVADHRRREFGSRETVQALEGITVAVPRSPYYRRRLAEYLPQGNVVTLDNPRDFFEAEPGTYDAMLFTAESGAAWTLLYPRFVVAIPHPDVVRTSVAYAMARGDPDWLAFVNAWVELKKSDGTVERLRRYWLLGLDEELREPRWSVIRDVLGWVD